MGAEGEGPGGKREAVYTWIIILGIVQAHKEEVYTENKANHGSDTTIMSKETRTDQNIETMLSSANTYSPRKASSTSSSRTAWEEDTLTEGERRE